MDFRSWLEWAGPSRSKKALVWTAGFILLVLYVADFLERLRNAPESARSLLGQIMTVLGSTSILAWSILLIGIACLLVATTDLWLPRLAGTDVSEPRTENNRALASIEWRQGLRHSRIDMPWEARVRIEFQVSGSASCYARWGRMVFYMSGSTAWEWSPQVEIMPTQMVSPGKVLDREVATIAPESFAMNIFGTDATCHPNHEELICCEIVVAVGEKLQREHRRYSLVYGRERGVAVLIDERRFRETKGTT